MCNITLNWGEQEETTVIFMGTFERQVKLAIGLKKNLDGLKALA